jgi:hypothetical protein
LYHAGLPQLKRSTFCSAMEKRDHRVFEDVFHAVAGKAQMIAGKTKNDLRTPCALLMHRYFAMPCKL